MFERHLSAPFYLNNEFERHITQRQFTRINETSFVTIGQKDTEKMYIIEAEG